MNACIWFLSIKESKITEKIISFFRIRHLFFQQHLKTTNKSKTALHASPIVQCSISLETECSFYDILTNKTKASKFIHPWNEDWIGAWLHYICTGQETVSVKNAFDEYSKQMKLRKLSGYLSRELFIVKKKRF